MELTRIHPEHRAAIEGALRLRGEFAARPHAILEIPGLEERWRSGHAADRATAEEALDGLAFAIARSLDGDACCPPLGAEWDGDGLRVRPEHARPLSDALEFAARLQTGQLRFEDHPLFAPRVGVDRFSAARAVLRRALFPELAVHDRWPGEANHSIRSPLVHRAARAAWEIHALLRHALLAGAYAGIDAGRSPYARPPSSMTGLPLPEARAAAFA